MDGWSEGQFNLYQCWCLYLQLIIFLECLSWNGLYLMFVNECWVLSIPQPPSCWFLYEVVNICKTRKLGKPLQRWSELDWIDSGSPVSAKDKYLADVSARLGRWPPLAWHSVRRTAQFLLIRVLTVRVLLFV